MSINLTTKFSDKIDERFSIRSLTDAYAGHNYDFDGAKTVKIYSVDSVPTRVYTRSGMNRYGNPVELGDTVQELQLTQDRAFTFTVDRGNASDQMNLKHAAQRLRVNWDEVVTPEIDRYRLKAWADRCGLGTVRAEALDKTSVLEAIVAAGSEMSNALVPLDNRVLFIRQSVYTICKLADEIMAIESLGEKSIARGIVGMIDGTHVVPVPDSWMPEGVNFIIKYRGASVDPMKLKSLRVHSCPPGIDGDLAECRYYYDAFVLDKKVCGVYVHAKSGMANMPALTYDAATHKVTVASQDGVTFYYTTDGSDPKTNPAKTAYSGAVTLAEGEVFRVYGELAGGTLKGPIAEQKF